MILQLLNHLEGYYPKLLRLITFATVYVHNMKFLCLAGMGTNPEVVTPFLLRPRAKLTAPRHFDSSSVRCIDDGRRSNFADYVVPITQSLERDGEHSFHYMAGSRELIKSSAMDDFHGLPPHLRFFESFWPGATDKKLHKAVRDIPRGLTFRDKQRVLEHRLGWTESHVLQDVLLNIRRKCVEEGPFDCILGYSEGAIAAATYVVDVLEKCAAGDDKIVPPKCAVFFSGTNAYDPNGKGWLHADKCGQVITIPTCHFFAHHDPQAFLAVGLYHLCDEEVASMLDHGRGHTIPRDPKSILSITAAIRDLVERTEGLANVEEDGTRGVSC